MPQPWKIVKIVDDYTVVINAGKNESLEPDTHLVIYSVGEEVIDPETGECLGTLDTVKASICVKHVFEKMSVCKSFETITRKTSPLTTLTPIANMLGEIQVESLKPLNVDPKQITGGINSSSIKIGDLVREA